MQRFNVSKFVIRQIKQLRGADRLEWNRKIKLLFLFIVRLPIQSIYIVPALIIVLTVRLVRPVIIVRFQSLISWRIGHFAGNTELYLCELDAGINRPKIRFLDIWYYPCAPCNKQLARMWNRVLHIAPATLSVLIDHINNVIPGGEIHRIGVNTMHDRDVHNLLDRFPQHLSFLSEEVRRGEMELRSLGIPKGAAFVCLAVRDRAYLNDQSPHLDWSRHDYRDCDIQNYILSARKLAERGYYVLRMGALVEESMNVEHPMIIDYATNGMRSDFMDIYLGARCAFCISTTLGFDAVPTIFRRPMVYVDCAPLGIIRTNSPNNISTSKKYWLLNEKRYMTFREIFDAGAGYFLKYKEYEDSGIKLIESSPEEIASVVLEMADRLRGAWNNNEEDEELQHRFWEIFPKNEFHGEIRSRIGASFLRQHRDWLE